MKQLMGLELSFAKLLLLHVALGILLAFFPFLGKVYSVSIIGVGLYFVVKGRNENNEALLAAAYITGSEVFLRILHATFFYQYGKFFTVCFIVLGLFYKRQSLKRNPYWLLLLLLLPGIIIGFQTLNGNIRNSIVFNISGMIVLIVCSLYTYKQKIKPDQLNAVLGYLLLPVIACVALLMVNCSSIYNNIHDFQSNFYMCGGFGPNQVSTILGLALFILYTRMILVKSNAWFFIAQLIILCYIFYRNLLTFSRGGLFTGIIIILVFTICFYWIKNKSKFNYSLLWVSLSLFGIFVLISIQTNNNAPKRYFMDSINDWKKKEPKAGRLFLMHEELDCFKENILLGTGVGRGREIRQEKYGKSACSHNEFTRLLGEHGLFGMLCLLLLLYFPLQNYWSDKENFFLLAFFLFWLLTVNHSALRIVAPCFIYSLALLKLDPGKK